MTTNNSSADNAANTDAFSADTTLETSKLDAKQPDKMIASVEEHSQKQVQPEAATETAPEPASESDIQAAGSDKAETQAASEKEQEESRRDDRKSEEEGASDQASQQETIPDEAAGADGAAESMVAASDDAAAQESEDEAAADEGRGNGAGFDAALLGLGLVGVGGALLAASDGNHSESPTLEVAQSSDSDDDEVVTFSGTAEGPISINFSGSNTSDTDTASVSRGSASNDVEFRVTDVTTNRSTGSEDTVRALRIRADDGAEINFSGQPENIEAVVFDIEDVQEGLADRKNLTLNTTAMGDKVEQIIFSFEDDSDFVVISQGSDLSNFSTVEVQKGTADLRSVAVANDVEYVVNSEVVLTFNQFRGANGLVSSTGLGRLTLEIENQAQLDELESLLTDKIIIGFGDNEPGEAQNITIEAVEGANLEQQAIDDVIETIREASFPSVTKLSAQLSDLEDTVSNIAGNEDTLGEGIELGTLVSLSNDLSDVTAQLNTLNGNSDNSVGGQIASAIGQQSTESSEATGLWADIEKLNSTLVSRLEAQIDTLESNLQGDGFDAGTDLSTFKALSDAVTGLRELLGDNELAADQTAVLTRLDALQEQVASALSLVGPLISQFEINPDDGKVSVKTAQTSDDGTSNGVRIYSGSTLIGSSIAGDVEADNQVFAFDSSASSGNDFMFTPVENTEADNISISIRATTATAEQPGADGVPSNTLYSFDNVNPQAPEITSGEITSLDATHVINGTAEAGAEVTLLIEGEGDAADTVLGTAVANQNGQWSITATLQGDNTLKATALDPAGNPSTPASGGSDTLAFTVNADWGDRPLTRETSEVFNTESNADSNTFSDDFTAQIAGYNPATIPLDITDELTVEQAVAIAQAGLDNLGETVASTLDALESKLQGFENSNEFTTLKTVSDDLAALNELTTGDADIEGSVAARLAGLQTTLESYVDTAISDFEGKLQGFEDSEDFTTLQAVNDELNALNEVVESLQNLATGDFGDVQEQVGNFSKDIQDLQSQIDDIVKPELIQRNELDNREELDEYESDFIRVELGEGDDFLNSSDADTEIVGGLGADTVNLTYVDDSTDKIVYQSVYEGEARAVSRVTFSTDEQDYREGSQLTLTINGNRYSYTTPEDQSVEAALEGFAAELRGNGMLDKASNDVSDARVLVNEDGAVLDIIGAAGQPLEVVDGNTDTKNSSVELIDNPGQKTTVNVVFSDKADDYPSKTNGDNTTEFTRELRVTFKVGDGEAQTISADVAEGDPAKSVGNLVNAIKAADDAGVSVTYDGNTLTLIADNVGPDSFTVESAEIDQPGVQQETLLTFSENDADYYEGGKLSATIAGETISADMVAGSAAESLAALQQAINDATAEGEVLHGVLESAVTGITSHSPITGGKQLGPSGITKLSFPVNIPLDDSTSIEISSSTVEFEKDGETVPLSSIFTGSAADIDAWVESFNNSPVNLDQSGQQLVIAEFNEENSLIFNPQEGVTTEITDIYQTITFNTITGNKTDLILTAATEEPDPLEATAVLSFAGEAQKATFTLEDAEQYDQLSDGTDLTDTGTEGAPVYYEGGQAHVTITPTDGEPVTVSADMAGFEPAPVVLVLSAGDVELALDMTSDDAALTALTASGSDDLDRQDVYLSEGATLQSYLDELVSTEYLSEYKLVEGVVELTVAPEAASLLSGDKFNFNLFNGEVSFNGNPLSLTVNEETTPLKLEETDSNGNFQPITMSVDIPEPDPATVTSQALVDAINSKAKGGDPLSTKLTYAGDFETNTVVADANSNVTFSYKVKQGDQVLVEEGFSATSNQTSGTSYYELNFDNSGTTVPAIGSSADLFGLMNAINDKYDDLSVEISSDGNLLFTTTHAGSDVELEISLTVDSADFKKASDTTDGVLSDGVSVPVVSEPDADWSNVISGAVLNENGEVTLTAAEPGKQTFDISDVTLDYQGVKQKATFSLDTTEHYTQLSDGTDLTDTGLKGAPVYYEGGKAYVTITPTDGEPIVIEQDMVGRPAALELDLGTSDPQVTLETGISFNKLSLENSAIGFNGTILPSDLESGDGPQTVSMLLNAMEALDEIESATLSGDKIEVIAVDGVPAFELNITGSMVIGEKAYNSGDTAFTAGAPINRIDTSQALVDEINQQINSGDSQATITIEGDFSGTENMYLSTIGITISQRNEDGEYENIDNGTISITGSLNKDMTLNSVLQDLSNNRSTIKSAEIVEGDIVVTTAEKGDVQFTLDFGSFDENDPSTFITESLSGEYSAQGEDNTLADLLENASLDDNGEITLTSKEAGEELFEISDVTLDYQGVKQKATAEFSTDDADYYAGGELSVTITPQGENSTPITVKADMAPAPLKIFITTLDEWTSTPETILLANSSNPLGLSFTLTIGDVTYNQSDFTQATGTTFSNYDSTTVANLTDAPSLQDLASWINGLDNIESAQASKTDNGIEIAVTASGDVDTSFAFIADTGVVAKNGEQGSLSINQANSSVTEPAPGEYSAQASLDNLAAAVQEAIGVLGEGESARVKVGENVSNIANGLALKFYIDDGATNIEYQAKYIDTGKEFNKIEVTRLIPDEPPVTEETPSINTDLSGLIQEITNYTSFDDDNVIIKVENGGIVVESRQTGADVEVGLEVTSDPDELFNNVGLVKDTGADGDLIPGDLFDTVGSVSVDDQGALTLTSEETVREAFTISDAEISQEPVEQQASVSFSSDDADYFDGGTLGLTVNGVEVSVDMQTGENAATDTVQALKAEIDELIQPASPTAELVFKANNGSKLTLNDADMISGIVKVKVGSGSAQITQNEPVSVTDFFNTINNQPGSAMGGGSLFDDITPTIDENGNLLLTHVDEEAITVESTLQIEKDGVTYKANYQAPEDGTLDNIASVAADGNTLTFTASAAADDYAEIDITDASLSVAGVRQVTEVDVSGVTFEDDRMDADGDRAQVSLEIAGTTISADSGADKGETLANLRQAILDARDGSNGATQEQAIVDVLAEGENAVTIRDNDSLLITAKDPGADPLEVGSFSYQVEDPEESSAQEVSVLFINASRFNDLAFDDDVTIKLGDVTLSYTVTGDEASETLLSAIVEGLQQDLEDSFATASIDTDGIYTTLNLTATRNGADVLGNVGDEEIAVLINEETTQAASVVDTNGDLTFTAGPDNATINDETAGRAPGVLSYTESEGDGGSKAATANDYTFTDAEDNELSLATENEFADALDINDQLRQGIAPGGTQDQTVNNPSDQNDDFYGDSASTGAGEGKTQTFTNPDTNPTLNGDPAATGDDGVSQTVTNPDSSYNAKNDSPAANEDGTTEGDNDLFGSDPGQYVDDGLETEYLSGGTDDNEDGTYESRDDEELNGRINTADGSSEDGAGIAGEFATEDAISDDAIAQDDKGFAPFDWGDGEGEAQVTVVALGNAEPDEVHNFQLGQDVIQLEGALLESTVEGDVSAVREYNSLDLSTTEFASVSSNANQGAIVFPEVSLANTLSTATSASVAAAELGDAEVVATLLNELFSLPDAQLGSDDNGELNTTLFAVTASDDASQTAIWAHTQSSSDDATIEGSELNQLALLHTLGDDDFGSDNWLPAATPPLAV